MGKTVPMLSAVREPLKGDSIGVSSVRREMPAVFCSLIVTPAAAVRGNPGPTRGPAGAYDPPGRSPWGHHRIKTQGRVAQCEKNAALPDTVVAFHF